VIHKKEAEQKGGKKKDSVGKKAATVGGTASKATTKPTMWGTDDSYSGSSDEN